MNKPFWVRSLASSVPIAVLVYALFVAYDAGVPVALLVAVFIAYAAVDAKIIVPWARGRVEQSDSE